MEAGFSFSPKFAVAPGRLSANARQDVDFSVVKFPSPASRRVAAREHLFQQGETATDVYEVLQGAIMVLRRLPGGRRQILDIAGPGRIVGLTAGARHDCEAAAIKAATVLCLDRDRTRAAHHQHSRIEEALFDEIHRLRDLATALGRKTAMERLAGFLLAVAGDDGDAPMDLELPVSRTEIGDHLGMTVETVCRNLARMKKQGVIRVRGLFRLTIVDFVTLRRLAAGNV